MSAPSIPLPTLAAGGWVAGAAAAVLLVPPGGASMATATATVLLSAAAAAAAILLRPAGPALVAAAIFAGAARAAVPAGTPLPVAAAQALAGSEVVLRGTVADDPRPLAAGQEILVRPTAIRTREDRPPPAGSVLVRVRAGAGVGVGDTVEVAGRLQLPASTPGFDRRAYLAQRGATLELTTDHARVIEAAGGVRALPAWLRDHYRSAVAVILPAPSAAVLVGVVLGVRTGIPPSLQQALTATGLVHLLVLSGLKVAVFARLAAGALRPLLGRAAVFPVVPAIALYALAGGATPAALRAAAMGCLALLALWLGRPTLVWSSLAWTAAAMLAWRPELAADIGFQLSFVGTAAIILLAPAIEHRLKRVPSLLREPFAVTLAAQAGTLPMTAEGFHVLSPVAPLANALTLPLLPVVVALGLVLAPLAAAPDLGRLLALPLAGMLAYIEQVAVLLARVPGGSVPIPSFPPWAGLAYFGAAGGALAAVRSRGNARRLAAAAAVALPLAAGGAELVAWTRPAPAASILAVGDGQAVLVSGPDGALLVGAGPSAARLDAELGGRLPPWRRRLSALLIDGGGAGQAGGLAGSSVAAATVVVPAAGHAGSAWRSAAAAQVAAGARLRYVAAGDRLRLAGFDLEVLAPEPQTPPNTLGASDLALRISRPGGSSICTFGNLDADAQAQAAARLRERCAVLVLPGQGRSAPSAAVLAAARPATIVASTGGGRLARGIPLGALRRTDQEGTVTIPL